MSLFNFNDTKSRRQIDKANNYRNNTRQQNANNILAYRTKMARLVDGRSEWLECERG